MNLTPQQLSLLQKLVELFETGVTRQFIVQRAFDGDVVNYGNRVQFATDADEMDFQHLASEQFIDIDRTPSGFIRGKPTAAGIAFINTRRSNTSDMKGEAFSVPALTDRQLMERAIENARKCRNQPNKNRSDPKVGAVIARDGMIVGEAYRGEVAPGEHAEFTLLERKLKDTILTGATLFATLEPCTSRGPGKLPCADHIIERRLKCVFIGVLDPNPTIRGIGERSLMSAGIDVRRFDPDLMRQIEELNREFTRQHEMSSSRNGARTLGDSTRARDATIAKLMDRVRHQRLAKVRGPSAQDQTEYVREYTDFWDDLPKEVDRVREPLLHQRILAMSDEARRIARKEALGCVGINIMTCDKFMSALDAIL